VSLYTILLFWIVCLVLFRNQSISASAANGEENIVHLYGTMLSQPTRSVYWFCLLNSIPLKFHAVNLAKGEQKSDEFTKINPLQKVPALQFNGKSYFESHNIIRFLAYQFPVSTNWYPEEFSIRSQIDTYLDWHHLNIRRACASLVFTEYFLPLRGKQVDEETLKPLRMDVIETLRKFESVFLGDTLFIAGEDASIADIIAYNEIIQMDLIDGDHRDPKQFPILVDWLYRMSHLPYHDEVVDVITSILNTTRRSKL